MSTRGSAQGMKPFLKSGNHTISIRESYESDSKMRVDREAGIIYHVKVLGEKSPNTHGKAGVKGTDYLPSAHQSLVSLIESCGVGGQKVNKNHTEKDKPNRDRTTDERVAWLVNPSREGNQTFADLHILKSDPEASKFFEAAERNPTLFALSINADGHYQIVNSRLAIDRFNKVWSVDIVTDGGSTVALNESKEHPMTLREALENLVGKKNKALVRLFETDSLLKPDAPADVAPAEATATAPEDDADYCAHLGKAMVAILNDDSLDQEAKKKKILAILKLTGDEEDEPASGEGDKPVEENDETEGKEKEKSEKDDEKKEMKESRERLAKLEAKDNVRTLCESLEYQPSKDSAPEIIDALCALPNDKARKKLIESLRGGTNGKPQKKGTGLPRTGSGNTTVKESGNLPKDAKEQATLLLRRS
jgi:hypothetical protein